MIRRVEVLVREIDGLVCIMDFAIIIHDNPQYIKGMKRLRLTSKLIISQQSKCLMLKLIASPGFHHHHVARVAAQQQRMAGLAPISPYHSSAEQDWNLLVSHSI